MARTICTLALTLFTLALFGCSKDNANIGNGSATATLGESLSDYAGNWEGYAEAYQFSDGTDNVFLTLDANGQGALKVGQATLEVTELDPDTYPPGMENIKDEVDPPSGLTPGFSYPISGAVVESRRIRVSTATDELFRDWCELQTSYYSEDTVPPRYACTPGGGGWGMSTSEDGTQTCAINNGVDPVIPISCARASCNYVCVCTKLGCSIDDAKDVQIDAALQADGEELQGTLVINGTRIVVRMTRQ